MNVRYTHSVVRPLALTALAGLFVVVTGCGNRSSHQLVQTYAPDSAESLMTTAPEEGDYVLYISDSGDFIARAHLKAGAPLGFKTNAVDSDGKPIGAKGTTSAVAGELVYPINPVKTYEWRRIPDSTQATKQSNPYWPRQ